MNNTVSAADRAEAHFRAGYNCSQAVYAALAPELGMDELQAVRIASMLGGGIARTRGVCGAVLGALLAAGTRTGNTVAADADAKKHNYAEGRELLAEFETAFGTLSCSKLLGLEDGKPQPPTPDPRTEAYYQSRPCLRCIRFAADMAERYLAAHPEGQQK
ncbi:MAG: C_GCAxxG_C_C family protein [Oscillospiraceae bacterium]|nr:C_GCAxxG_C_C family protein [Oscillospiraceae bacterium]MBQ9959343.1 C_GCAxxG_C_C family protein [Oscillospiraceae bacterium]